MVDFLMTGVRDSRERLRQGVAHGTGHHSSLYDDGTKLNFDIKFFFAFDWENGLFRCEREEPRISRMRGLQTSKDIYFRMPGRSVQHNTRWGEIQILREDFGIRRTLHAFDLRAVGLLYQDSYQDQMPFSEVLDLFIMHQPQDAVDEGAGVYRVCWVLDDVVRRTIWLNRNEGFSVTRLEVSDRRVPPMPLGDDGWPLPFVINEATWAQVNNVWVPKTFRIHDRTGLDDSTTFWRYDHEFDWKSVNEPLPKDLFDIDKLGAKKGTLVVNYQRKAPIVERVIGVDNARIEGESPRKVGETGPQSNWGSLRALFTALNVALVVSLASVFIARKLWARRKQAV